VSRVANLLKDACSPHDVVSRKVVIVFHVGLALLIASELHCAASVT